MYGKLPQGKGLWIRRLLDCENGDPERIATRAQAAGFTHIVLKIADGADPYNVERATHGDAAAELIRHLTAGGIDVWGWHPVYGDKPRFKGAFQDNYHLREAEEALDRVDELDDAGLCGYIFLAQGDYERAPNRAFKATQFIEIVHAGLRDFPIALAAWKNPKSHPRFPWAEFRNHCDLDMPQVFWIGAHGEAAHQLENSVRQFAELTPRLPYVPTGPAFFEDGWRPSPEDLADFFAKASELGLRAANLFNWDQLVLTGAEPTNHKKLDFTPQWQAVAEYVWKETDATPFWLLVPEIEEAPPVEPAPQPVEEYEVESRLELEPEADTELPEHLRFLTQPELEDEIELYDTYLTPELAPVEPAPMIAETLPAEEEYDDYIEHLLAVEPEVDAELPEHLQFILNPELTDQIEIYGQPVEAGLAPVPASTEPIDPIREALRAELAEEAARAETAQQPAPVKLAPPQPRPVVPISDFAPEPGSLFDIAPADHLDFSTSTAEPVSFAAPGIEPLTDTLAGVDFLHTTAVEPIVYELAPEEELFTSFATEPEDALPEHLQFLNQPDLADEIEVVAPLQSELDAMGLEDFLGAPDKTDLLREMVAETEIAEPEETLGEPESFLQPIVYDITLADALELQLEPDDDLPEHLQFLRHPTLADEMELIVPSPTIAEAAKVTEPEIAAIAAQVREMQSASTASVSAMPEWVTLPPEVAQAAPEALPEEPAFTHTQVRPEVAEEFTRAVAPPAPEEPLPDWLAEVDTSLSRAAEPLPDWLADAEADLVRAEQPSPAATLEPTAEAEPSAEAMPDWLADANAALAKAGPIEEIETVGAGSPRPEVEAVAAPEPEPTPAPIAAPEVVAVPEPPPVVESIPTPIAEPAPPAHPELAIPVQPIPIPSAPPMPAPAADDIVGQLFFALRSGELDKALTLYGPSFALVSSGRVVRDTTAAREFYQSMSQRLEVRTISLLSQRGSRAAVNAHWASRQKDGSPVEGTDTFHLNRDGQIVFHQTTLRVE